jgi:hypothetical protein
MSYTITLPDGTTLGTIADGTVDNTATSLTLIGRNYSNYGQIMVTDLLALLVNFSYNVSPAHPQAGQLWWDSGNTLMKAWTGTTWKNIGSCTSQATAPTTTIAGDLWWDSSNQQLYVYNGTSPYNIEGWILVGPQRNGSGAVWEQISDGTSLHDVVSVKLDGVRTAIISADSFVPSPSITGFGTIRTGWNMNSDDTIWGTTNNASYLGNQPAASYLRNDIDSTTVGNLTVAKNGGLTIGLSSNLQITTATNGDVSIKNTKSNGDINFYANVSGTNTLAFGIDGATGTAALLSATLSGSLTLSAGATVTGALNVTGTGAFSGNLTAPTQSVGTADTTVATTEFVVNNSGFLTNKIYAPGKNPSASNTYISVNDTGTGNAMVVIDGATVATASASGFNLYSGATAITMPDTYNGTGNAAVATTQFVKTASTWWGNSTHRSAKWVSTSAPSVGVNDIGSNDGDFWFQIST